MKTVIGFRATYEQRRKLELLAEGEGTSIPKVLTRLIDELPVVEVKRQVVGLERIPRRELAAGNVSKSAI